MGGGAWPFLVGGVICLVNSDNERDLRVLTSYAKLLTGESLQLTWLRSDFGGWIPDDLVANFLNRLFTRSKRKLEAITGL